MKKYRSKEVIIEAEQWFLIGDLKEVVNPYPKKFYTALTSNICKYCSLYLQNHGWVETLEGGHIVCPYDWIIKGLEGEYYPCKPSIFSKKYEAVYDKIGATGNYPDGKLNQYDMGELNLAVGVDNKGNVVLQFGKPVTWLAMTRDEAKSIGEALLRRSADGTD